MNDDDELEFWIGLDGMNILVAFSQPVGTLWLEPEKAEIIAKELMKLAEILKRAKAG